MRNSVNAADKLLQPNYSYASSLNLRLGKQKVHATFQAKQSCFFFMEEENENTAASRSQCCSIKFNLQ